MNFKITQAERLNTILSLAIVGASGGGKTMSGLRLATGMQSVTGGDIVMLDTENRRGLHYADDFNYKHVDFQPPHGPLEFIEALKFAESQGGKIIIIDSASSEHEGEGGVLDWHEQEMTRMAGGNPEKMDKVKMLAWAKPKTARRRLYNYLQNIDAHTIWCFRAKEKVDIVPGKGTVSLGWQPVGALDIVFSMFCRFLLEPGSNGRPTYETKNKFEAQLIKSPVHLIGDIMMPQLCEEMGQLMAEWAVGKDKEKKSKGEEHTEFDRAVRWINQAESSGRMEEIAMSIKNLSKEGKINQGETEQLRKMFAKRLLELES